jgi:hypothetical protein
MAANDEKPQIKFISKRAENYRLEFVNGAISNITARGEIVCDFYLESRDRPTEQFVESIADDGTAKLSAFRDTGTFTRDIKFGMIINAGFAESLVRLLNDKIKECKEIASQKTEKGDTK